MNSLKRNPPVILAVILAVILPVIPRVIPRVIPWVILPVILLVITASCAVFEVGGTRKDPVIERNQQSSIGVVYLWKAEIDSNNLTAASELMRHRSGRALLATERYDMTDDLKRWKTLLLNKPITTAVADTVNDSTHTVRTKMDYIRNVSFSTVRYQGKWWITKID
ncbi:MAG: hypothetical protein EHM43_01140 [Ignavibacteriae bacterium]|nr:MAG: hypothetical protein EHM43_01140 [Ignavibacteriota bacterium]